MKKLATFIQKNVTDSNNNKYLKILEKWEPQDSAVVTSINTINEMRQ